MSQRIPQDIWHDIERDFLKQIGVAILDYVTFREVLTEEDRKRLAPVALLRIARTVNSNSIEAHKSLFCPESVQNIEDNLTWAMIEGYMVAACVTYGFRYGEVERHRTRIDEWVGQGGSDKDRMTREWQLFDFARNDGLRTLYAKRPVVRFMLEELIGDVPVGGLPAEIEEFKKLEPEGPNIFDGGMLLQALLGASLFEFDLRTEDNEVEETWLQRANACLHLKPNMLGIGLNLNAVIDYAAKKSRSRP